MKTKQWYVALLAMAVVVGIGSRKAYATIGNPVDATITITPQVTLSLNLPTTTYAFGSSIPLSSAAVSVSSLAIINQSQVNVGLDTKIQLEATNGWISDISTGTINHYVLWVATGATQPAYTQFAGMHQYTPYTGVQAYQTLRGIGGGTPSLTTSGAGNEVDLWFRLDTPSSVTTGAGQTITVRFNAVAN